MTALGLVLVTVLMTTECSCCIFIASHQTVNPHTIVASNYMNLCNVKDSQQDVHLNLACILTTSIAGGGGGLVQITTLPGLFTHAF